MNRVTAKDGAWGSYYAARGSGERRVTVSSTVSLEDASRCGHVSNHTDLSRPPR